MKVNWEKLKYFSRKEFGPEPEKVAPELVLLLERIREVAKTAIHIHCTWADGGHSTKSYHYTGLACDFHFASLTPRSQYCLLREFREIGGLGFYPTWNNVGWHVDLRDGFLQWVCRNGVYQYGWQTMSEALK